MLLPLPLLLRILPQAVLFFMAIYASDGTLVDFRYVKQQAAIETTFSNSGRKQVGYSLMTDYQDASQKVFFDRLVQVLETGKKQHLDYSFRWGNQLRCLEIILTLEGNSVRAVFRDITHQRWPSGLSQPYSRSGYPPDFPADKA